MLGQRRVARSGVTAALALIVALPFLVGQGCPGPLDALNRNPVDRASAASTPTTSGTGNTPPTFSFTSPTADVSQEVGDIVQISWIVSDPDSNASIEIFLDPDGDFANGNERTIVPLILEDSGVTSFNLDTQALNLPPATYRIVARIKDGVNPDLLVVASGHILLYGSGLLPGNKAPTIVTTKPDTNFGASQNDQIAITFCGSDRDDGPNSVVPDIVLLLDLDSDPNNDLDLRSPIAASSLSSLCQGALPASIPGAIILACFKDTDCVSPITPPPNGPTNFTLTVDVGLIPPTPTGNPYRVRTTMWDHLNAPVSSYAPGSISITALGSGTIDLAQVGRTISGSRFQGFDTGGQAGFAGLGVGDIDADGADDFVIVERFGVTGSAEGNVTGGTGLGSTNGGGVGTAHLIFGLPNQKFAGQISLNSVSVSVRGTFMTMYGGLGIGGCQWVGDITVPGLTGTDGIYSIARVGDINFDGKPEFLFGLPYVEQFFDYSDDDPCDCGCPKVDDQGVLVYQGCYIDGYPNPLSSNAECEPELCGKHDFLWSYDIRETSGCSNDLDLLNSTRIDGGYALLVSSENQFNNTAISLNLVGQKTDRLGGVEAEQFPGARWRGAWYDEFDLTQTTSPFSIIPDNRFGQTVNSMPNMLDTRTDISPRFGPTVLISAPNGAKGKGLVHMFGGADWTRFPDGNSVSMPVYSTTTTCTCADFAQFFRPLKEFGGHTVVIGKDVGDNLGYAAAAGDYNLDGSRDILAGAPGASRVVNGQLVEHGGIVYILFGRRNFGGFDLGKTNPPRMEIRGTNANDQFGLVQTIVGDVNEDGLPDIGFATPFADGPGGTDAGFIGIVFGGRLLTGENIFNVSQVGTPQLPGCKIYGAQVNGHAGAQVSNVGDFNGDGIDDLLISAPDETITINGLTRRGLAYVLFGGPHLINTTLSLSQVGSAQLPGIVIVTPYVSGSADEAPIDSVAPAGDVNGDGFDDILLGVSKADFVNPLEPGQRRTDSGEMYLIYGSNTGSNALR